MMELSLSFWVVKEIEQKHVRFVFLASIHVCAQFESTSQQAIMPLSDMADLHVSESPRGRGSLANSNVEQDKAWIKAYLAQRSAGEVALQRNCSRTRGGKTRIATRSHVKTRVPPSTCAVAWCTHLHIKHDYMPENIALRMCLNPVSSSQEQRRSLLCFSSAFNVSYCHFYLLVMRSLSSI